MSETIHRVCNTSQIFLLSRALAQSEVSTDCLAILVYLLSKPADWSVKVTEVERHFKIGRIKRRRAFAEAEALGHLTGEQIREPDGTFGTIWRVYDEPVEITARSQLFYSQHATGGRFTACGGPARGALSPIQKNQKYKKEKENIKTCVRASARIAQSAPVSRLEIREEEKTPALSKMSNHPAVQCVRSLIGHYPKRYMWPVIIDKLGADFSREDLARDYARFLASKNRGPRWSWLLGNAESVNNHASVGARAPQAAPPAPARESRAVTVAAAPRAEDAQRYDEELNALYEEVASWARQVGRDFGELVAEQVRPIDETLAARVLELHKAKLS